MDMRRLQLLITGMALLYLVVIRWSLAVHGITHVDNARDLAVAWRIVHRYDFPLVGPLQTGLFHLGPLYSYLSAIPLALFGTAASLIFFISLLSLAGLYFGYKLGELLFDRAVGLVFAALLGGDFMASISSVQGGHTALLISSCLMYMWATCSAILRREARCLGWAIVAAAIALQMHLVAAALLPLLVIALLLPMNENKTRSVAIGFIVAFALYIPYLIYQVSHGLHDLRVLFTFLKADTSAALRTISLASLPRLFLRYNQYSAAMAGGFSQFVVPWWARVPIVAGLRLIALASLLGIGVALVEIIRGAKRVSHGLVVAWLLLGWMIIPFLRPSLPWYIMYPVYPAHLLLASAAIARVAQAAKGPGVWRFVPYGLVGVVFLLSPLLMAQTFSRFAQQGRLEIPAWLMKDVLHERAESPGKFVIPYLGARREERMVQWLTSLPGTDTSMYWKIHGVPLWSVIFSRASLFLLHPPRVPSGESSPYHLVGVLRTDLPGRPVGQVSSMGPLVLVRSLPALAYESARYSFVDTARWYEPGYDDGDWKRISLPGSTVPAPLEYPPWNYPRSNNWARRPVYFRLTLVHQAASPTFLGVSFPTFASSDEEGAIEHLYLNGVEVGHPHLRTGDLDLYDITPFLRKGDNLLALAVDGGPHFIPDLFTVSLER